MPRSSLRNGLNLTSSWCSATITRAMPFLSSLNAEESMTAMLLAAAAAGRAGGAAVLGVVGLVCVCARVAKLASATMAMIVRNTFMALLLHGFRLFGVALFQREVSGLSILDC